MKHKFWHQVRAWGICGVKSLSLFLTSACSTFLDLGDSRFGCCCNSQRLSLSLVYHHLEFTFGKGAAFSFRFANTVVPLLTYNPTRKSVPGDGLDLGVPLGSVLCATMLFQ